MSIEALVQANTAALEALTAAILSVAKLSPSEDSPKAKKAAAADTVSKAVSMTAEELSKKVVATVQATSKAAVLELLDTQFKVKAGKEITEPAERKRAWDALDKLATEADPT